MVSAHVLRLRMHIAGIDDLIGRLATENNGIGILLSLLRKDLSDCAEFIEKEPTLWQVLCLKEKVEG